MKPSRSDVRRSSHGARTLASAALMGRSQAKCFFLLATGIQDRHCTGFGHHTRKKFLCAIFRQLNIHCPLLGIRRTFAFWSRKHPLQLGRPLGRSGFPLLPGHVGTARNGCGGARSQQGLHKETMLGMPSSLHEVSVRIHHPAICRDPDCCVVLPNVQVANAVIGTCRGWRSSVAKNWDHDHGMTKGNVNTSMNY